ncbi:MAG: ATP-dependent Clp protease adapter ClpS [Candidatus Hydrogenedentes bacterium]|nr:ATP-dependent Clp protease adapter ClpS [Candidatus Hydrogenedentota bacterium]
MAEYIPSRTSETVVRERQKVERPRRYKVLLLNDDYTTMEFVVLILEEVFQKTRDEAVRVMLNVHENGKGVAGVYVKDIAETKIAATHKFAQEHGYPLKCGMEPE